MGYVAICIGTAAVFEDVTRFFCFSGLRSTATLLSPGYQIQFASQHNSGSIAPEGPRWEAGVMGQEPGLGRAPFFFLVIFFIDLERKDCASMDEWKRRIPFEITPVCEWVCCPFLFFGPIFYYFHNITFSCVDGRVGVCPYSVC